MTSCTRAHALCDAVTFTLSLSSAVSNRPCRCLLWLMRCRRSMFVGIDSLCLPSADTISNCDAVVGADFMTEKTKGSGVARVGRDKRTPSQIFTPLPAPCVLQLGSGCGLWDVMWVSCRQARYFPSSRHRQHTYSSPFLRLHRYSYPGLLLLL